MHVAPAAHALGPVAADDLDGELWPLAAGVPDLGLRDDEQHVEPGGALPQQRQRFAARRDHDLGFERRANRLGLPLCLEGAVHHVAHGDQPRPALDQRVVPPGVDVGRQQGEVHGRLARAGQGLPQLVGGDRQDRRQQPGQAVHHHVHRGLGRTARLGSRTERVDAVLRHVRIEGADVDGGQVRQRVDDGLEVERVVGLARACRRGRVAGQDVAIDLLQALDRHAIAGRVEVEQVAGEEAQRVAELAVGLDDAGEDLLAQPDFLAVVHHRRPQADDLGAVLLDHVLRRDGVAEGLRHRPSFAVDAKPCGGAFAIWRFPAQRDPDEK